MKSLILDSREINLLLQDSKTQLRIPVQPRSDYKRVMESPLGNSGDSVWIRETGWWKKHPGGNTIRAWFADRWKKGENPWGKMKPAYWISPEGMPEWASRITLILESVRVERIQDISEDDAIQEGVQEDRVIVDMKCYGNSPVEIFDTRFDGGSGEWKYENAYGAFAELWESEHGNWDENPWVWVYSFKVELT